ncbi:sugar phosphate isomerase/epimerase family protein [Muriicola soli]|uniref:Sugar phosphate isomerase/epimerase n=1 Tax=Muriicola soli TaxID=2507538 RepID=A0A411ECV0_9FLAO|nr:sugar phosphate isomerase/epimerase family protein [Muriicola soli]QBA65519.1 sugar phosphate isomerase/epimerase [Muriicola soli]
MKRRRFVRNTAAAGLGLAVVGMYGCKQAKKEASGVMEEIEELSEPFFKLSLAQWSVHRMIWNGEMDPYDFAAKAKEWGFSGLEYVSQLYDKELSESDYSAEAMAAFVARCNSEAEKHGLENVLIMIDRQGDLATTDKAERMSAVENHHKWVDAAQAMGCHAIRVNLSGSTEPDTWVANSVDGLTRLATYAKDKNINILVENHGGLSSNAAMLAEVMTKVNMDNCGTLPDFGNFCIRRNDPADYRSGCAEMYDLYKGVEELMPFAKAVSAKSHNFDEDGNETEIDYTIMLQIVKDAGYTGYIGVEYEGNELEETKGIMATKELMLKSASELT